ncbi:MAG TPA: helicase HerA-like domain-containing protein [Thermodesulfobacteriota bacterium]|nr:helicase HerA-like domain-containing protein [Thermodesulfobacteriota bacterium]
MGTAPSPLLIAKGKTDIFLLPKMANRHGLIAGATGTGKTVTLRVLAEQFSKIGVPIFMADVKGDLSGLPFPGGENPKVAERVSQLGLKEFRFENYPVTFWDVFGEQGHPVRATISEMGPLLLSRILGLNEIQSGVLSMTFKIADENGLLLLDLKDLRAMAQFVGDHAGQFKTQYGNISAASIGAIQRNLLTLEEQGGEKYFGEPALNIEDLMQTGSDGKGMMNILTADKLMQSPRIYATFLLWLLSELFERLPEVGDPEKPRLVFFFDEAHLLFEDVPKALEEKIEQVVRLIRSKGVGVYFITQNPLDLPETVLGQLGNRVQHALRAFTPKDQKSVKVAAETFRVNPKLNVVKAITELGVGEALVSVLDEKGTPTVVERALVYPPHSRLSPLNPEERNRLIRESVLYGHYEKIVDRESAYERLKAKTEQTKRESREEAVQKRRTAEPKSQAEQLLAAAVKSAAHAVGSQLGRQIIRGVLGSIFGGTGKR